MDLCDTLGPEQQYHRTRQPPGGRRGRSVCVPNSATWRDSESPWRHEDGAFRFPQDMKLGKDSNTYHSTGNTQGTNLVNPSEDSPQGRHEHLAAEEIIRAEVL